METCKKKLDEETLQIKCECETISPTSIVNDLERIFLKSTIDEAFTIEALE